MTIALATIGLALFPAPLAPTATTTSTSPRPSVASEPAKLDEMDHRTLALNWLADHEMEVDGLNVDQFFDTAFLHLDLGAFELRLLPDTLADWSPQYVEAVVGLVGLQRAWLGWMPEEADANRRSNAAADLDLLESWAGDLRKNAFKKLKVQGGEDALVAMEAPDDVRAAAERLSTYFGGAGPLGLEGEPRLVPFVIAPTREDFVSLVCVVGLLDDEWQHAYWLPDIVSWTHCRWAGARVLALEFAAEEGSKNFSRGLSMTFKNKRALVQHIVQLGARSHFQRLNVPALFAVALANNLTIELYGEVDTRNDGDTSARKIEAVDIFVPGALNDGTLPPANADSRWRRDKGEDYFLPALREGQKEGSKKARSKRDRLLYFRLEGMEGGNHYVKAPFFGPGSEAPPDDFLPDYVEFLRAYRAGFLHWLREFGVAEGEDAEAEAHQAFARFLELVAGGEHDLEGAFAKAYPLPLSEPTIGEDCLEGRFLAWLADKKKAKRR